MSINWNPPGRGPTAPSPVSTGLASIQDMLEAFHSRRQQREIAEMQEQRLRDAMAMEAGFKRVDDEREAHRIELENSRGLASQELKKAELDQNRRQWAASGFDNVMKDENLQKARDRGDFADTNARLSPFGAQWQRQEAPQLEAPPVPEAPKPTERDAAGLQNHLSDVMYGILPRNTAVPEAEATSPQALQQLPQRLEQGQQEHDRAQGYADRIGAMNQQTAAEYQKAPVYSLVGDIPGAGLTYRVGEGTRLRNEALRPIFDQLPATTPEEQRVKKYVEATLGRSTEEPAKVGERAREMYDKLLDREAHEKNARISASNKMVEPPHIRANAANQAIQILQQHVNDWQKESGYDTIRGDVAKLKSAQFLLTSKNALNEKAARFGLGKAIAGPGSFTEGEQRNIIGSVAGKYGQWESTLQAFQDGTMGEQDRRVFVEAVASQLHDKLGPTMTTLETNFRDRFMTDGSGYENMQKNVANQYNALFGLFGRHQKVTGQGITVGGGDPSVKLPEVAPPAQLEDDEIDAEFARLKGGRK